MDMALAAIDRSNYQECIDLELFDHQRDFVAPNLFSLVQAAYEPDMHPLGIYLDGEMIGFILYDFDPELDGWSMSRFMIDRRRQGKGLGRQALKTFLEYFREKHGDVELHTSAETRNAPAIALYEAFGFVMGEEFSYEVKGKTHREYRMSRARRGGRDGTTGS